ncbi:MAG: peptide chain release factor 3 [Planctomycetota bacterium]|nr:peptide chain release factor 3 [Planctomycetota bacterium]
MSACPTPTGADRRLAEETRRRRTFAIISHPDAGKTTLTEKLLLYAGAVQTAGLVRASKGGQGTVSDWLSIERERGISVTSSAMQLPYKGASITILDTPGHNDFCEDTYRTLLAADSAVMVIDAAKGVEAQTKKLFAVCARRGLPILTFMNKLDLRAQDPLDLMTNVEEALGIQAAAMSWPIGSGRDFAGIIDRSAGEVVLFDQGAGRTKRARERRFRLDDPAVAAEVAPEALERARHELELLDVAGNPFDKDRFLRGELTPVFFGSALSNFGVEDFFDAFVDLAPCPPPRQADVAGGGVVEVDPVRDRFSAFVFKVQANMNPKHRDNMAFMRICSGRFERDMVVKHHRTGKQVRMTHPYTTLARERTTVDEAFPGDVIGIVDPGAFIIGDTVSLDGGFDYKPLPQLAPTVLARIRPRDVGRRKAFDKGLDQLVAEGTVQAVHVLPARELHVAAVGKLQFEVLQHRLRQEYGVETELTARVYEHALWLVGDPAAFTSASGTLAVDGRGRHLALFDDAFSMRYALQRSEALTFVDCL